jgi:hypothetical protein
MRALNDPQIDELRDVKGNLFGGAPAQEWVKPKTVVLREKSFRNLLEGTLLDGSELEFDIPWTVSVARRVKLSKTILERFLCLAGAPDAEIHKYASRFGPLLIFCRTKESDDHLVVIESCEVWRYFAACMKALLHMAASFHRGRSPDSSDWNAIGFCPFAVLRIEVKGNDWMNPSPMQQERAWKVMACVIQRGKNRDRTMWGRLLNALLGLGRVRPWVDFNDSGNASRARMTFTGSNLLSYLALQVCLTAAKHPEFAVCSHCRGEYPPVPRAPKAGQRNFCPDCRAQGVPVRTAQRSRRERQRQKR